MATQEVAERLVALCREGKFSEAVSIQAGRVMPSLLLRKPGSYSRKSLLDRAFHSRSILDCWS
jgi:hypothetical protein